MKLIGLLFIKISILKFSLTLRLNLNKILIYLFSSNLVILSVALLFIIKLFSLSILKLIFFVLSIKSNSSKLVICSDSAALIISLGINLMKSNIFNESSKFIFFFEAFPLF